MEMTRECDNNDYYQQVKQALHDINSPLQAMKLMVDHLAPQRKKFFEMGLERMQSILEGISVPQAQTEQLKNIELKSYLQELIDEKKWEYKLLDNVYFTFKANQASYSAIPEQGMKRALSNILNNSVEALGEQGLIEVALYKGVNSNIISIKDNGIGLAKQHIPYIFKPGVSFKRNHKNQGLGLSYAKRLIESAGGSITLSSQKGFGSEITIILPQCKLSQTLPYSA